MTMTDPIADMLTRIRNANVATKDRVTMPSSKVKEALALILKREGYIEDFEVADRVPMPGKSIDDPTEVQRRPGQDDPRRASRVSKPGLRVYTKAGEVPACSGASGSPSCPPARACSPTARRAGRRVGGEVLCYVW